MKITTTSQSFTPPPPPPDAPLISGSALWKKRGGLFFSLLMGLHTLAFAASPLLAQTPISFDLSKVRSEATTHQDTVNGLTLDMATSDRWSPNRPPGFQTYDGVYVHTRENGVQMTFTFNQPVRIIGYTINIVNTMFPPDTGDIVRLSAGGETTDETNYTIGSYDFSNQFTVAANTPITLISINPGGALGAGLAWSELRVTVVPEPAVYALLLGGVTLSLVIFRRRRR